MKSLAKPTGEKQAQPLGQLRDSPQRWVLAGLLFAGMIFCFAPRGALSVAAKDIMLDLRLSKADLGLLLSAFFWSYSLLQVPAGWLVDRYGVKRSYAGGLLFWSLASAMTGLARSLLALNLLRMLLGMGQAVAFPASARAVANWFRDRERGTVTATYLTGVRLGQALVSLMGAALLPLLGWKFFFLLVGAVPLVWLLPWFTFLNRWDHINSGPEVAHVTRKKEGLFESLRILKNRSVLGIFVGFFAYDYVWFVYLTWLPGYLEIERGFTKTEMGIYSAIPYVGMSIIIMAAGLLSDWFIRRGYREIIIRKSFIAAGLMVGCLIIPAGLVEDKMSSVILLSISLCGLGLCSPNTWTLTQAVCSKQVVGTASGIQNFGGNLGGVIAPALTGYIAHVTHSFSLALCMAGAMCVLGILSYLFLIPNKALSNSVA